MRTCRSGGIRLAPLPTGPRCATVRVEVTDTRGERVPARPGALLTLDRRHFRRVRPLTGHTAFRLWPDAENAATGPRRPR